MLTEKQRMLLNLYLVENNGSKEIAEQMYFPNQRSVKDELQKIISRILTLGIAMDIEDLDVYNGDTEHDMWVDFDYHQNTGELSDDFTAEDLYEHYDDLDDDLY